MAQQLPSLAQALGESLIKEINAMPEPYRDSLLAWLGKHARTDFKARLDGNLVDYLDGFDHLTMYDQYNLIRIVIKEAERIFRKEQTEI